ncbi:hypothetical protein BMG523Draft_03208, partial [Frankia sp. BMG5.23]
ACATAGGKAPAGPALEPFLTWQTTTQTGSPPSTDPPQDGPPDGPEP